MVERTTPIKKKRNYNPWKITSFSLIALLLIVGMFFVFSGVSKNKIGKSVTGYISSEFQIDSEIRSIKSYSKDLYEISLLIEGELIPVYATKDGKNLIVGGIYSLKENPTPVVSTNPSSPQSYSQEDLVALSEFSTCLASKGVKVYGANWCGYTNAWVNTLGGYESAAPVYVECTEEQELCSQEGITGYPTTKINGELYNGARTLESIGQAVGCVVPTLSGGSSTNAYDASC